MYPSECPPVLVHLPIGSDMAKFKQIKYLSSCAIEIQRYKPSKKSGTQCFRCQGFGHASRNCNRPAQCVKCGLGHPTWECPKKGREEPARCCNCQQDHPANYSQCNERLKYIKRIQSKRETVRKTLVPEPTSASTTVPNNVTWAEVTKTTQPPHRSGPETSKPTVTKTPTEEECNKKISPDYEISEMLEILTALKALKQDFIKCKTFMDKVILILTHLGHYV